MTFFLQKFRLWKLLEHKAKLSIKQRQEEKGLSVNDHIFKVEAKLCYRNFYLKKISVQNYWIFSKG